MRRHGHAIEQEHIQNMISGHFRSKPQGDLPWELGLAFGLTSLKEGRKKVCVGGDNRLSTRGSRNRLRKDYLFSGCEVVDIGIPTPTMYYAVNINAAGLESW